MIYRSMAHLPIMGPRRRRKVEPIRSLTEKPEALTSIGSIQDLSLSVSIDESQLTSEDRASLELDEQARREAAALQAQMQQAAMGYYNPLAGYTGAYRPQSALGSMGNLGSAWPLAFGDIGERLGGSPK